MVTKDSNQQKKEFFERLAEDGGKLNPTWKGFVDEFILPITKWIMAKIKPG